ncbi:MAG: hypothetical protein WD178_07125 [Actinomycetota bacterium]
MAGAVAGPARPWPLALGVGLAACTLGIYIALLVSEGNNTLADVAPVLLPVQAALVTGSFGLASAGKRRRLLAAACGVLLLVVGLIGLASIGIGFLVAAGFCFVQVSRTR